MKKLNKNVCCEVRNVTKDDIPKITYFLRDIFFKDEPLNAFLELVTDDNPTCETLEEFTVGHIPDGVNLMAIKDNEIVGLCLCVSVNKVEQQKIFDCQNEKYNKLVRLLDYADKQCDPFQIYPECSRGISVQVISVAKSCRGMGIATTLIEKASVLAKEKGYQFITIACTSLYSSKLAEKLNFRVKFSLDYTDYKENGQIVFKPDPPHTALTIYLKKL
ncbi:arylalkylamine N-acetyltransferase 1-like isoform X1 [Diorhabda sublineata]|uniref:arylalkylamine N-acetyltransferase 1-like isoform X1 n=2 Tax=Diorhabda sublineata TaxID=1163346 RepID=UPI0024E1070A|nr:arylalkylamine N-acetyltransferase 1-like isoform X1 [Diorhabda sublineata]